MGTKYYEKEYEYVGLDFRRFLVEESNDLD
jgi:hypothetical protein